MLNKNSKIFVAGHNGMVGSAIIRALKDNNYKNIYTISKNKLNLTNQKDTYNFLKKIKPDCVIVAAAKVGGIVANNNFKGDFILENLLIQNNLIIGSFENKINNLIFLGSSCAYPKKTKIPIKEEYLLSGPLEPTNEPYAVAKISGIKLCESISKQYKKNYFTIMPTNLYGPNDNYDLKTSHVLPALIKKVHLAKIRKQKFVKLLGTGKAKRDYLYVDDFAQACVLIMKNYKNHLIINVGSQSEISILNLTKLVMKVLDYEVKITFDKIYSDGTLRKMLDTTIIRKMGWKPITLLETGIEKTYKDFLLRI